MHYELVFICAENDTYRLGIAFGVHLFAVVIEIEIHLADVLVLNLTAFKVDKHEAFKNTMIKHKVNFIRSAADCHFLLPTDIGKALAELKKKETEIINESLLQIALCIDGKLGKSCKFKYIGFAEYVFRALDDLTLPGKANDLFAVGAERKTMKQHTFHLALQFTNAPMLFFCFLLIE